MKPRYVRELKKKDVIERKRGENFKYYRVMIKAKNYSLNLAIRAMVTSTIKHNA